MAYRELKYMGGVLQNDSSIINMLFLASSETVSAVVMGLPALGDAVSARGVRLPVVCSCFVRCGQNFTVNVVHVAVKWTAVLFGALRRACACVAL